MIIAEVFFWWYTSGWLVIIKKIRSFLINITDFFSMSSLIRTLFKPFRQISATTAQANASLDLKFHMFIDRLVSRIIGFFSRLILILTGLILIIADVVLSLILIVLWPFIPLLPIAGLILTMKGIVL